jgi:predicted transcriptional regulator
MPNFAPKGCHRRDNQAQSAQVRARFEQHFTARRMAEDHTPLDDLPFFAGNHEGIANRASGDGFSLGLLARAVPILSWKNIRTFRPASKSHRDHDLAAVTHEPAINNSLTCRAEPAHKLSTNAVLMRYGLQLDRKGERMPDENPPMTFDRDLVTKIVVGYVRRNQIATNEIGTLISTVHQALASAGKPTEATEERTPAVSIRRSVRRDRVICIECGWSGKMLRRHITGHGLSVDQYRRRWNLSSEHPLVAPAYAEFRSAFAKQAGLGRRSDNNQEQRGPSAEPPRKKPTTRRRTRRAAETTEAPPSQEPITRRRSRRRAVETAE